MASSVDELESDIAEAKRLLAMSRQSTLKSILIAFIKSTTAKQVELLSSAEEDAQTVSAPKVETKASEWEPITRFAWDQGDTNTAWVTVSVECAVKREEVECSFDASSFDLRISKRWRLVKNALDRDIVPEESFVVVKPTRVLVRLRKVKGPGGSYDLWARLDKAGGKKERDAAMAPRYEGSQYYDVVKTLYERGGDSMKKKIGEAIERNKARDAEFGGPEGPLAELFPPDKNSSATASAVLSAVDKITAEWDEDSDLLQLD